MNPLTDKKIILGVTGSIAAYKAADLASKLTQAGAQVEALLSEAATHFISPLTFQSVTGQPAYTESDLWGNHAHVLHIGLARKADMILIAPASANTIAKLAHGLADNLLLVTALAAHRVEQTVPLLLAPAMDAGMYSNPATQENIQILTARGAHFIGPEEGHLASGLVARGRMTEPSDILAHARYLLSRTGPLAGKRVVITAGGTREPIDPVRFITNRSSGKQGYALAQAALDLGAQLTLISNATNLPVPGGAELVVVEQANEMEKAVLEACKNADILIMAAAVADFRPKNLAQHKIKKGKTLPPLELIPNPDILVSVQKQKDRIQKPDFVMGFAAETRDLITHARTKLRAKGLDLIAANDVSSPQAGFQVDTNQVTLLWASGDIEAFPLMGKQETAETILTRVVARVFH